MEEVASVKPGRPSRVGVEGVVVVATDQVSAHALYAGLDRGASGGDGLLGRVVVALMLVGVGLERRLTARPT